MISCCVECSRLTPTMLQETHAMTDTMIANATRQPGCAACNDDQHRDPAYRVRLDLQCTFTI